MSNMNLGHQAEDFLLLALPKIGISVVDRSLVGTDPGFPFAIARATVHEDWEDKTDFWFFVRRVGWKRLDLTTARDQEVLRRKRAHRGVCVFCVNFGTLERASRGCEKDLAILVAIFESLIREFISQ